MIHSETVEQVEKKLVLLDKLIRQVPIWALYCRNDDDGKCNNKK